MEFHNYISKYCEKTSAPKKISYIMHNFPKTTFYIKIIFHFPKKNNFMLVTPRGATYLELFFSVVVFPTVYYVNMSL